MIAYKFLAPGATGRFSRFRWPPPTASSPGAWIEAASPLKPCARGIHACRRGDLAFWLDRELWCIELAGEQVETGSMVVAARGRLLSRVSAWDEALGREFAEHCRGRARVFAAQAASEHGAGAALHGASETERRRELARKFAEDVETLASAGQLAAAAYVSAVAAHLVSSQPPDDAYAAERSAQSAWLAERLKLA